jgi:hypothetical protein
MPVLRLGHPQGMLTLRLAAPVHLHAPKESLSRCHHWLAVWSFAKGGKGLGQPLPRANLPPPSPARASHRRHPCRPPRHQLSWHPIVASRHGLPRRHPCGTPAVDAPACRQLQPDLVRRRRIHLREGWIRLRRHWIRSLHSASSSQQSMRQATFLAQKAKSRQGSAPLPPSRLAARFSGGALRRRRGEGEKERVVAATLGFPLCRPRVGDAGARESWLPLTNS